MVFLDSLDGLGHAIQQDRVHADDRVYVPRAMLVAAGEAAWTRLDDALRGQGAVLMPLAALSRIAVVSIAEISEGQAPDGHR